MSKHIDTIADQLAAIILRRMRQAEEAGRLDVANRLAKSLIGLHQPLDCPECAGLGFVIVDDHIDYGQGTAYFQHPDVCPGKCCSPRESEARFRAWEAERREEVA